MAEPQEIVVHIKVSVDDGAAAAVETPPWEHEAAAFLASLDPQTVEAAALQPNRLHMGGTAAVLDVVVGWLLGTVNIDGTPR